jgi:calcium/calmodulin-dependent protein kinase I
MYLAMEYMPGGDLEANLLDLESSMEHGLAIPEEDIKEITSQILEGLKIMHVEGFVHRDLKPKVQFFYMKY